MIWRLARRRACAISISSSMTRSQQSLVSSLGDQRRGNVGLAPAAYGIPGRSGVTAHAPGLAAENRRYTRHQQHSALRAAICACDKSRMRQAPIGDGYTLIGRKRNPPPGIGYTSRYAASGGLPRFGVLLKKGDQSHARKSSGIAGLLCEIVIACEFGSCKTEMPGDVPEPSVGRMDVGAAISLTVQHRLWPRVKAVHEHHGSRRASHEVSSLIQERAHWHRVYAALRRIARLVLAATCIDTSGKKIFIVEACGVDHLPAGSNCSNGERFHQPEDAARHARGEPQDTLTYILAVEQRG